MKGPARKSRIAGPSAEGAIRVVVALKSTPSLVLPARMAHLTGMLFHSRSLTRPYADVLNGETRFCLSLSIGITSDPAGMSWILAAGPGRSGAASDGAPSKVIAAASIATRRDVRAVPRPVTLGLSRERAWRGL